MWNQGDLVQVRQVYGRVGELSQAYELVELQRKGTNGWELWLVRDPVSSEKLIRWVTPDSVAARGASVPPVALDPSAAVPPPSPRGRARRSPPPALGGRSPAKSRKKGVQSNTKARRADLPFLVAQLAAVEEVVAGLSRAVREAVAV